MVVHERGYLYCLRGDILYTMFKKLADLFGSSEPSRPNLLDDLGLSEWYNGLSQQEREKVHEYSTMFGLGGEMNLLDEGVRGSNTTQQSYLKNVGAKLVSNKEYDLAEKVLLNGLDSPDDNPTDRHFIYNSLIDLYYKQRDEREDAIERCIECCKADIDSIDEFHQELQEENEDASLPRIPAFKRLAIIYERQGEFEKALEVCEEAIQRSLSDGTQGGFEARRERIENKMDQ